MFLTPDLLLDCITVLFHDNSETNKNIVKEIVTIYEGSIAAGTGSSEQDAVVELYVWIINLLLDDGLDRTDENDVNRFLIKIKSNPIMEKRREIYDLLSNLFTSRETLSEVKLAKCFNAIQTRLLHIRMNKVSRMFFGGVNRVQDMANVEDQSRDLKKLIITIKEALDETEKSLSSSSDDGAIETVSFNNKQSMKNALKKNNDRTIRGVIKTGLQGLNMAFGKAGGLILGESVIFNAPSYHGKSLILQLVAMWAAVYNTPAPCDGKMPLIILFSLENEAFQNFIFISSVMYYQATGKEIGNLAKEEVQDDLIDWVYDEFEKNGFKLEIIRQLPDTFGYEEIVQIINYKEKSGFVIHLCVIDYINKMRKGANGDKNASSVGNHLLIKELYSKLCNYFKTKGITLVSAHQLNRDALKIGNIGGKREVVKYLNADHLAESVDVQREPDVLFFMYKEYNYDGIPFLTMRIDKHRYVNDTPDTHKHFAYPFTKHGILADINGTPMFTRDIYNYKPKDMSLFHDNIATNKQALDQASASDIF
jgi:hypothetical protein